MNRQNNRNRHYSGAPTGDRNIAVTVADVNKTFLSRKGTAVEALRDINIDVADGEVLAVIGPSGCGKSTLLRLLSGLDTTYDGIIEITRSNGGSETGRLPSATVFQTESTLPWLTVKKNLTAVGMSQLSLSPDEKSSRAESVLKLVGLHEFMDAYPYELSGGMRQRVSIARALAPRPHLLLMDEPLSALDAQTRLVMQQELLDIWAKTKSTVVYITHDIEEAVTLADRVVVLSARPGRITMIRNTPVKSTNNAVERRRTQEFGDLVVDLWDAVAGSVGSRLSRADETSKADA